MTAVARVYRWEIAKLLAQKRTYLGLGAAMLVPIIFVVVLVLQTGGPNDVPLGRYIRDTGPRDAVRRPLLHVDLGPAADHRARRRRHRRLGEPQRDAEDDPHPLARARRGLRRQGARDRRPTRSRSSFSMGVVGARRGHDRLGLPPAHLALGHDGLGRARARSCCSRASAIYALPLAGIAAFGVLLSTVTRNSAASVVGTLMLALLMQLLGVLPGTESIRPYLLGTQFDAWHGFLRTLPTGRRSCARSGCRALYIVVPLFAAYLVFLRRDVAGD